MCGTVELRVRFGVPELMENSLLVITMSHMVTLNYNHNISIESVHNCYGNLFFRLVMPMMQSYIKAGDFTVRGKLKSALIDNAIYYGSYLFICGILLIYLALKPGIHLDG